MTSWRTEGWEWIDLKTNIDHPTNHVRVHVFEQQSRQTEAISAKIASNNCHWLLGLKQHLACCRHLMVVW